MSKLDLLPTFEHFDPSLFDPTLLLSATAANVTSAAAATVAAESAAAAAADDSSSSAVPVMPTQLHQLQHQQLLQLQQLTPIAQHPLVFNFSSMQQSATDTMSDFSSTTGDDDTSGLESSFPLTHNFDFLQEMVPGSPVSDCSSVGSPFVMYSPSPLGPNGGSGEFDRTQSASSADGRPLRHVRLQGSIRRRYEQLMPELAAQNKKKMNKRKKKAPLDLAKLTPLDKEVIEDDRLEKNRQSARDCRLRKKFYIKSLEQKVEEFEMREQQRLVDLDQAHRELDEVRTRYELLVKHYQQLQPFASSFSQ